MKQYKLVKFATRKLATRHAHCRWNPVLQYFGKRVGICSPCLWLRPLKLLRSVAVIQESTFNSEHEVNDPIHFICTTYTLQDKQILVWLAGWGSYWARRKKKKKHKWLCSSKGKNVLTSFFSCFFQRVCMNGNPSECSLHSVLVVTVTDSLLIVTGGSWDGHIFVNVSRVVFPSV